MSNVSSPHQIISRQPSETDGSIIISGLEAQLFFSLCGRKDAAQNLRTGSGAAHRNIHVQNIIKMMDKGMGVARVFVARLPNDSLQVIDGHHTLLAATLRERTPIVFHAIRVQSQQQVDELWAVQDNVFRARSFASRCLAIGLPNSTFGNAGGGGLMGSRPPRAISGAFLHHSRFGEDAPLSGLEGWRKIADQYGHRIQEVHNQLFGVRKNQLRAGSNLGRLLSYRNDCIAVLLEIHRFSGCNDFFRKLIESTPEGPDTISRCLQRWISMEYSQNRHKTDFSSAGFRLAHCWNCHVEGRYHRYKVRRSGMPIAGSRLKVHTKESLKQVREQKMALRS